MDIRKQVEVSNVSAEMKKAEADRPARSVRLVEMGQVSVETKGVARGVEIGFTPKS